MDDLDLVRLFEECSNTGRWGRDDELGTLNLIDDEKRRQAARLVQTGRVVAIGQPLCTTASSTNVQPPVHLMLLEENPPISALDFVGIAAHGLAITHLDAVGHVFWEGKTYNGRKSSETLTTKGLLFGSIQAQRCGIFTRGVLLDIAAARETDYLPAGEFVTRSDIEAAEDRQQVRIGRGDAVILNVGMERLEEGLTEKVDSARTGVDASVVRWLYEREVAVYSGDCIERLPYPSARVPLPLHQIGLASMGLCMLDNPTLRELVGVCREIKRWDFLLTCAPIEVPMGTGVAVNPLCVF